MGRRGIPGNESNINNINLVSHDNFSNLVGLKQGNLWSRKMRNKVRKPNRDLIMQDVWLLKGFRFLFSYKQQRSIVKF